MKGRIIRDEHQLDCSIDANRTKQLSIQESQELIYEFLIEIVNQCSAETTLLEFNHLFIFGKPLANSDVVQALYKIVSNKNEEIFINTLKRACYILINNWSAKRRYQAIQALIQTIAEGAVTHHTLSPILHRLRTWLASFVNSKNYEELKLYVSPYTLENKGSWTERYTSYLLVAQSLDSSNPIEQRTMAKTLSKQLKEKFNFELAMYTTRCDYPNFNQENTSNPTRLGHGAICVIKKVVSQNLLFSYASYAHIFNQQTKNLNYRNFKHSLHRYLIFSISNKDHLYLLNKGLLGTLDNLYKHRDEEILNFDILLRTSRRLISLLTTQNGSEPSALFILISTRESFITLVIVLLKIILICQQAHTHLDFCIAKLIHYYETFPERECQWFIKFLETFNIVFAIFTENVQYNLVKVKDNDSDGQCLIELDAYRIFSQLKGADLRNSNLSGTNICSTDLSAADLRGANLSGCDLTQADLSLAKLRRANLSKAMLNGTDLSSAMLDSADLTSASLNGADLRCADMREANLSGASLTATKLRRANLQDANLSGATLSSASLIASNLSGADLREADLQCADLSEANLSNANLSNANLSGADLRHAKLCRANLSGANLYQANLSNANLIGANLVKANLSHANLNSTNLDEADLSSAFLRGAVLSEASLTHANLSRADLSRADLSRGNLSDSNLSDAILRHVNLKGANLSQANLSGTNLFSTNVSLANLKGAQFRNNSGLLEGIRLNLEQQGAIVA